MTVVKLGDNMMMLKLFQHNIFRKEVIRMTNRKLLLQKIESSGLKLGFIAEKLGISYNWLKKKIDGEVPFKVYEVQILCNVLNIRDLQEKENIFFAENVASTKDA